MQFVFFGPDELKMWLCSSNEKQETKESNTVYDNVLPLTTMPRPPSLKEYTKGLSHTIYFCTCDTKKANVPGKKVGVQLLKCVTYRIQGEGDKHENFY